MQVAIKSIKIRKRIRKDLGDISGLAESMARYGQLHPILITKKNQLVAGRRRLAAAKSLGWTSINASILRDRSPADCLELELDENVHRSSLSRDEIEDGLARLERLRNPGFFRRIWLAVAGFFRRLFRIQEE